MGLLLYVAGALLVADQLTKLAVQSFMPLNSSHSIIPGFFNLIHVRNTGAAFSIFAGEPSSWRRGFFIALSIGLVGMLTYAYTQTKRNEVWLRSAYACIVGGALGNLIDRVRLGEVVDFVEIYLGPYRWPAFNIADSAISVGAVVLFVLLVKHR